MRLSSRNITTSYKFTTDFQQEERHFIIDININNQQHAKFKVQSASTCTNLRPSLAASPTHSGAGEIRERWRYRQAFQCGILQKQHVVYLLQKWSTSWGAYIDVESVDDIKDKDRLTVVPMPVGSPKGRRLCNNRLCKSGLYTGTLYKLQNLTSEIIICGFGHLPSGVGGWAFQVPSHMVHFLIGEWECASYHLC